MKKHTLKFFLNTAFLAVFVPLLFVTSVQAHAKPNLAGKTFIVKSAADSPDANVGDGKCKSVAGKCTLRAAIQESNALAGPNTILVPQGEYKLTVSALLTS